MSICPGTRIKELRQLSGMSQEELGRRVGVQRAAINKYEKGTVSNIPLHTIERIAATFDVSPNYIVGWSDADSNLLSTEVKILQGIKQLYGDDVVELIENYVGVDGLGKRKIMTYSEDMWKIYSKNGK